FVELSVHDRLTGATEPLGPTVDTGTPKVTRVSFVTSISADGHFTTFEDFGVSVRGVDPTDLAADLTGDGDLDDTVLRVFDTGAPSATPLTLGPADAVAVANGTAAFLRPEAAGAPGQASGIDLDGDGDTTDDVVHLWTGAGEPQNLGRAATAIALSDRWLAALVSEAGQGNTDLNGNGETAESVVQVYPVGISSGAGWTNVGQAADTMDVAGSVVTFITPEAAQGHQDLNRDGDATDRVLQVYDADAQRLLMGSGAPVPPQDADGGGPRGGACGARDDPRGGRGRALHDHGPGVRDQRQLWRRDLLRAPGWVHPRPRHRL